MRSSARRVLFAGLTLMLAFASTPAATARQHRPSFRVFVAGDSTAATYPAGEKPQAGWGQALPVFLHSSVEVVNRAVNGTSSKSFIDLGYLDRVLEDIAPGDYLLISFGHNDEKDDPARHTDPFTTYQDYLFEYIDGARQRGATPVLVTSVERRRFDESGNATPSHGQYPEAMRRLGVESGVPVVDLAAASRRLWQRLGVAGTKEYFLWLAPGESQNYPGGIEDDTHFQAHGAIEVARILGHCFARTGTLPPEALVRLDAEIPDDALTWQFSSLPR